MAYVTLNISTTDADFEDVCELLIEHLLDDDLTERFVHEVGCVDLELGRKLRDAFIEYYKED